MRGVVDGSAKISTGTDYQIKGYDLIGKTGTAEISSSKGGYLRGNTNYVKSFAGLFPGDEPQIIVYVAASKMKNTTLLPKSVKHLVKNVGTYLNIYEQKSTKDTNTYTLENYTNKDTETIKNKLDLAQVKYIVLGEGKKIIKQYPFSGTTINSNNQVFILTNAEEYIMPDIKGWSRSDVSAFANLVGIDTTFDGIGYVKSYNIKAGSVLKKEDVLEVKLEKNFKK